MSESSMDQWIGRLNDGDVEAVERVFRAYEPYLRMAVRRRLSLRLRAKVDSADVVQSVFADMVAGIRDGRWRFSGREQVLALLQKIARRRLADRYQEHARAIDCEQPLTDAPSRSLPDLNQPRPSQVVQGREFWEAVLKACPPQHHDVVRLRANGFKMAEIATKTGLHEGSVRRVLYDLARSLSLSRKSGNATRHLDD